METIKNPKQTNAPYLCLRLMWMNRNFIDLYGPTEGEDTNVFFSRTQQKSTYLGLKSQEFATIQLVRENYSKDLPDMQFLFAFLGSGFLGRILAEFWPPKKIRKIQV